MDIFYLTLHICASKPGIVRINGQILGDTAYPIVAPISMSELLYIEWLPLSAGLQPCFARLEFENGELVQAPAPDNCRLYLYEASVFELEFIPPPSRLDARTIPHIVCQRTYVHEKTNYSASVYYDSGYILSIENQYDYSIAFADYVDFSLEEADLTLQFIGGAWFICAHTKTHMAVLRHQRTAELIYAGEGTLETKEGALLLFTHPGDRCGRRRVLQYSDQRQDPAIRFTSLNAALVNSPAAAAFAFLFSIQYRLTDDALFFLDPALAAQSSLSDYVDYFGDFELMRTPVSKNPLKYPHQSVALLRKMCENIYMAKTFHFEIAQHNGLYKIINISEG